VNTARTGAGRVLGFLPLGFMAAIVLGTYAAIVWTLRRGFDWTDEAFVDTMIASNRWAIGEPWGFQHLLHPLYIMTGQSVLVFRVLRLAGYVLLSIALVSCARFVVRRMGISIPRSGWVFIFLLAQVGTFLAWSFPPRYLGYNELASWFAQLGVALILVSLTWGVSSARSRETNWQLWSIWAGLGALTTLLVFAKVTSGIAFGAVLAFAAVIPNPNLRLWKRVVGAGTGAAFVLFVLWVSGCPIVFYFKNMFALMFNKSTRDTLGRPVSGMMSSAIDSLFFTGRALIPALLIFVLLAGAFHRRAKTVLDGGSGRVTDGIISILGILLVIALVALPKIDVWSYLGEFVGFIGMAGIIGLVILEADRAKLRRAGASQRFSVAVGGSAVVAAPFISSVGTSNRISGQLVFAGTLWAVALGIALVLMTQHGELLQSRAQRVPALVGCVVILMAAFAVSAAIAKPYHTAALLSQETPTSVPELSGLLLTKTDAAWIDWVAAAGASLKADGVPATAIYSSGALYAFNHSGYAHPWVGSRSAAAFKSLSIACTVDPPPDLFVLQPGTTRQRATSGVTTSLAECGIKFPGDFSIVAHRASKEPEHSMTIWRLKSGWFGSRGKRHVIRTIKLQRVSAEAQGGSRDLAVW